MTLLLILRTFIRFKNSKLAEYISLEIVPLTNYRFEFQDVRKLMGCISDQELYKNKINKFLNLSPVIKLDLSYSKATGLRYIITSPKYSLELLKQLIQSNSFQVELKEIKPPEITKYKYKKRSVFSLTKHYSYPIISRYQDSSNSLLDLLHGIDNIGNDQLLNYSIKLYASSPFRAYSVKNKLIDGDSPALFNSTYLGRAKSIIYLIIRSLVMLILGTIKLIEFGLFKHRKYITSQPILIDNPNITAQLDKLYEPLFKSTLEINIYGNNLNSLDILLSKFNIILKSEYSLVQSLKPKTKKQSKLFCKYLYNPFASKNFLSSSEISDLFHIPSDETIKHLLNIKEIKNLAPSTYFRSLNGPKDLSLIIGLNSFSGSNLNIGLNNNDRKKHLFISGSTGSGKTSLLENSIISDIKKGYGVSVIDPHGDMAEKLIHLIPKDRLKDLIYFSPSDLKHPIGLNLLELKPTKDITELSMEIDRVSESLVSLFRKIFLNDEESAHRIEYIIRNTVHTALSVDKATIFTIYRLLTDPKFRIKVVSNLKNKNLINFWNNEFGRAGSFAEVKMASGVTTKIGRFLFSEPARRTFGQHKSTIDFEQILDQKKILICNFSKGNLGEDGSRLFAVSVLTKIQLEILKRANSRPDQRQDHYLYVDEFQNFATNSFVQLLAETRKYKLFLTIAEQSPSSQDEAIRSVIFANVGNFISFKSSSPKDESILLPIYGKQLEKGDLINLAQFNFYLKTSSTSSVVSATSLRPLAINLHKDNYQIYVSKVRPRYVYKLA